MTVKELIMKLMEMPQDHDVLVEVNGEQEYPKIEVEQTYYFSSYRRVLLKIDGVEATHEQ